MKIKSTLVSRDWSKLRWKPETFDADFAEAITHSTSAKMKGKIVDVLEKDTN
jgi:molecular chaperone GrpE (heat shock protein)